MEVKSPNKKNGDKETNEDEEYINKEKIRNN
jgi:hypothetical protein